MQALQPFTITKVDHTGITVSSLAEALVFWVEILGFHHVYTWDFESSSFLDNVLGLEGAAVTLAMVEGPGHQIELLE